MTNSTQAILFDTDNSHQNLLPLTYTRSAADLRVGIHTIAEKWKMLLGHDTLYLTVDSLRPHYGNSHTSDSQLTDALFISADILPDEELAEAVRALGPGSALADEEGLLVALRGSVNDVDGKEGRAPRHAAILHNVRRIRYVYDVFLMNGEAILEDFCRITSGRTSKPLPPSCRVIGSYLLDNGLPSIFIEDGAIVEGATINVSAGPVYVGRDAQIMEGCCVRGPLAVCDNARIRMGARVYGNTTIGPYCKVGGEIDNVVFNGFSNKAHDGYLGNAVIGEWCNIGAGVNASNLKNNYAKVRVWNYAKRSFMRTDLQFCGLIMGDHSKVGINCMFNTATVVGVGVNMHGCGFPRVFIPSFSEGSPAAGFSNVRLSDFFDTATRVMSRRGKSLTEADRQMYELIYDKALEFKGGNGK